MFISALHQLPEEELKRGYSILPDHCSALTKLHTDPDCMQVNLTKLHTDPDCMQVNLTILHTDPDCMQVNLLHCILKTLRQKEN